MTKKKLINNNNECAGCGNSFTDKDKVNVILSNIEIELNQKDNSQLRLKLSEGAITSRTILIYCNKCLNLKDWVEE